VTGRRSRLILEDITHQAGNPNGSDLRVSDDEILRRRALLEVGGGVVQPHLHRGLGGADQILRVLDGQESAACHYYHRQRPGHGSLPLPDEVDAEPQQNQAQQGQSAPGGHWDRNVVIEFNGRAGNHLRQCITGGDHAPPQQQSGSLARA